MPGINKVFLIGYLDNEPYWEGANDDQLFFFQLRIETPFLKNGKKSSQVDLHTIVMRKKLADMASRYVTKEKIIYIEGKVSTHSVVGKDGVKRYRSGIIAEYFKIIGRPGDV